MSRRMASIFIVVCALAYGLVSNVWSQVSSENNDSRALNKKLFREYKAGKKLTDEAVSSDATVRFGGAPPFLAGSGKARPGGPNALVDLVCSANAVIVGTLRNQSSVLTDDEQFVFTNLDIDVEQVLKQFAPIPEHLVVVRPGGVVAAYGHKLYVNVDEFHPLRTGERYMFLLRYVPESNSYRAFGNGTFRLPLEGSAVEAMGPQKVWQTNTAMNATKLITAVRAAVSDNNSCGYDKVDTLY